MERDFLSQIVEHKKKEIIAAKQRVPESFLRQQVEVSRKRRSFLKQLEKPGASGVNIIAEIKRASPSKGDIRPGLDPVYYAGEYDAGGAAALSVLTDQAYFKARSEDFRMVRNTTVLPVLRKDFLISAYQIYESAVMQADAVLLIVRILEQRQIKDYLDLCRELRMDVLVEVHSESDIETARMSGARLIGINNRNLRSFETDIETAIRMKSLLDANQVAVAASGIQTREDIDKIKNCGIWNFLIGESLVRSENPREFLKSLHEKKPVNAGILTSRKDKQYEI